MAKSSKLDDLMSIIAQAPTAATPKEMPKATTKTASTSKRPKVSVPAALPAATGSRGRFSSIYLNPEDQRILREFSVWFAGQGRKINDTLIIRAALRAAKPGGTFLAAYDEATLSDRRFKKK